MLHITDRVQSSCIYNCFLSLFFYWNASACVVYTYFASACNYFVKLNVVWTLNNPNLCFVCWSSNFSPNRKSVNCSRSSWRVEWTFTGFKRQPIEVGNTDQFAYFLPASALNWNTRNSNKTKKEEPSDSHGSLHATIGRIIFPRPLSWYSGKISFI